MARSLDDIADDIRAATAEYENRSAECFHLSVLMRAERDAMTKASDLMDQYRDELLEAANGG